MHAALAFQMFHLRLYTEQSQAVAGFAGCGQEEKGESESSAVLICRYRSWILIVSQ